MGGLEFEEWRETSIEDFLGPILLRSVISISES